MNQVFDMQRWVLLVRKHWGDNRNKYLLSLGAIAALLFLWFGFLILMDSHGAMSREPQTITFYVGLFLTGSLTASLLFSDLGNKPKALNFLAVPASQVEKILCMIFYGVVVFFVCYTVVFYVVDFLMVKVANAVTIARLERNRESLEFFTPEKVMNVFGKFKVSANDNPFNVLTTILCLFFALQGAYALGSIYFPAYSFIKTTITLLITILLFIFLVAKVLSPMLPDGGNFSGNLSVYQMYKRDYSSMDAILLPSWTGDAMVGYFKYLLAPAFWIATYFRLKEKEV